MIKAWEKNSTIDYPGKLATVLFTKSCNFTCPYCYNFDFIKNSEDIICQLEILDFLEKRKNLIDAVVISGGEPCLENDLYDFCKKIKNLGYLLKLDTNGSRPKVLEKLLPLLDYVALDIKADFMAYPQSLTTEFFTGNFKETIKLLNAFKMNFEIRTTCVKPFVTEETIIKIAKTNFGEQAWYLQKGNLDKAYDQNFFEGIDEYTNEEMENLWQLALKYKPDTYYRNRNSNSVLS